MNRLINKKTYTVAALFTIVGLLLGLIISSSLGIYSKAYSEEPKISKEAIAILSKTDEAMAEVAAAVKPAVVNVSTTRTIKTPGITNPLFNDPFFRQFFGNAFGNPDGPRELKQASLGSGVIIDKAGYILTNNHVVKDADEIRIKLSDGREFKGKVIGTDQKTDIAVIKINSDHLPVLKIGDSDRLKVGERVLAIGNPFGLNQTVTAGIVSATDRANMGISDYENFIQTDAPINPGNSGGALVNVRGELIGINTAIFSTSGGYQGIGFAIPSNMAKAIMESLIKNGKVVRGWLGVSVQGVTPEIAKQFGLKERGGALVGDVVEGSPAEKAGLKRGDVIIKYDGNLVNDPGQLKNMTASTPVGKEVLLSIIRDGKNEPVKVRIAELPSTGQTVQGAFNNLLKGIHVQNMTPEIRKGLAIPERVTGVIVTDVEDGTPAESVLARNDVILEIDKNKV
ncbi:MAG TPA: DegQ family serine endoprotease, partial [Dissulfurispiraceae bacterium]|nr:DegQ family serine endoprotease [Dissulfurispiraceae bacterium]